MDKALFFISSFSSSGILSKSLNITTYMVFNKIDAYEPKSWDETELVEERGKKHYSLGEWEETWMSTMNGQALFISALNKENLKEFRNRVYDAVRQIHVTRLKRGSQQALPTKLLPPRAKLI